MLHELYQDIIIDHGRQPRNQGELPAFTHQQEGHNPLCGDRLMLYVQEQAGVIQEIRFEGAGCALSVASASLMTEAVKGKTLFDVEQLFEQFHQLVTTGQSSASIGKLAAFSGVAVFPIRVKCTTLAWHTLKAALMHNAHPVTTE
jgi:nitrogen fixation protein NifU and related proteins